MKILFKITSRSRRTNFLRAVDSIINNVSDKGNYHLLISLDDDDTTMKPLPVINCPHTFKVYKKNEGETITKISAINRDVNDFTKLCDWDVIINVSDDQIFTQKGFDDIIRDQFYYHDGEFYDLDLDQFVHFPDGFTEDRLATMSIMGRAYYNRFKYIYHPDYISLYCDNEAMEVARALGCYKYVHNDIFTHLHPANGNAPNDAQYRHTESFHPIDKETYLRRKQNNFDL